MINLYSARENIDKERFIYENITGEAIVIVPDQYTLIAEEQALKYLNTKCLYDVEVMSMNRLGLRVLQEQGKENTKILDQYGRFMLLSRIIKKHKADFDIYQKTAGKPSFTLMLSDFISAFKQQNCTIEDLRNLLGADDTDELLKSKLGELELIVKEYQDSLSDKYTNAEDYISLYISTIKDARFLAGKSVWVYGFDTLTPKFIKAILELSLVTKSVNIIINANDFHLDEILLKTICSQAKDLAIKVNVSPIEGEFSSRAASQVPSFRDGSEPLCKANVSEEREESVRISSGIDYSLNKSKTIKLIEKYLFANAQYEADEFPSDLKIVRAANPYYEAETAANYIYHLLRDEHYLMRDIQIIANDAGTMQPIIKSTFEEYGLPVFMDQPRSITDSAAVSFIMNLLWFVKYGKTDVLMAMLKTGLAGYEYSDIEDLENYASAYKIKGNMWKSPFKYGAENIGEEKFAHLEQIRASISEKIVKLEKLSKETVSDFVNEFKKYLDSEWELLDRVEALADKQLDAGLFDEAQRMVQSYQKALELLDQIIEIMGDEEFDLSEFIDIYLTGLKNVEVGVIPQALDGLSMGTMIRTRPRPARAVVILGANEGTLPLKPSTEGLFSVDEKNYFKDKGFALGALDDIKMDEENVAMYRMMSKPSEKLYISYSMTDADGGEAEPSEIIDSLIELFPRIERDGLIEKDIISAGWTQDRINAKDESMRHLVNHLKDKNTTEVDPLAEAIMAWMEQNQPSEIKDMMDILQDENDPKGLGHSMAKSLYSRKDGNIVLSASAISGYFDCPFKYFIDRGLKPQEDRKFASDPRSIGDVYHKCLEDIAIRVIGDKDFGAKIIGCSDDELEKLISDELDKIAKDYNGGLFISSGNEEYRMERIKEICVAAVRAVAKQLTDESMQTAKFEAVFGRHGDFDPIEFEVDGEKVYVEGKIDRADIMVGDNVRIIDYKTGTDKLDTWKMSQGYKMQLMIYLISATSGELEPAGMYYFNIKDPIAKYNGIDETKVKRDGTTEADKTADQMFQLKGKTFDDPAEFMELKAAVLGNIESIANGISAGKIDIRPFKDNKKLVCGYCQYKAICKRDRNYVRNTAWELKPKVKEEKEQCK